MGFTNGLVGLLVIVAVVFLVPLLLKWLWNTTMPDVFNVKEVNYWQAFRLIIIAAILFGSGRTG